MKSLLPRDKKLEWLLWFYFIPFSLYICWLWQLLPSALLLWDRSMPKLWPKRSKPTWIKTGSLQNRNKGTDLYQFRNKANKWFRSLRDFDDIFPLGNEVKRPSTKILHQISVKLFQIYVCLNDRVMTVLNLILVSKMTTWHPWGTTLPKLEIKENLEYTLFFDSMPSQLCLPNTSATFYKNVTTNCYYILFLQIGTTNQSTISGFSDLFTFFSLGISQRHF